MNTRFLGSYGEDMAAEYLTSKGYNILERNFHAHRNAEIDIIANDGTYYVFIEVKTRMKYDRGFGREAVTAGKQRSIRFGALYYLTTHRIVDKVPCRFDVIEITMAGDTLESIEHIENAF